MGLFEATIKLWYPDRCVLCGEPVGAGELCCPRCPRAELKNREKGWVLAPFVYQGQVQRAVARFKFQGDRRAGRYLAQEMEKTLRNAAPGLPYDCLAYVPMPEERERRRGYNQAKVLAEEIARGTGLPVSPGILVRQGVFAQHQMAASFRKKGAQYTFFGDENARLEGLRVVLVDDLVTTGETARSCARLLRELGAKEVTVLAAAR